MDYTYIVLTIKRPNSIVTKREFSGITKGLRFIALQLEQNKRAKISNLRYSITPITKETP